MSDVRNLDDMTVAKRKQEAQTVAWKKAHPERNAANVKAWKMEHPEQVREQNRKDQKAWRERQKVRKAEAMRLVREDDDR